MIERLLCEQCTGDVALADMLTHYRNKPAFFYQKSPQDNDAEWEKPCYPRVDFSVDMRYDPERKAAGVLSVNIWCSSECALIGDDDPDKAIENRLLSLVNGTFYTGEDASVCAIWNRSDAFSLESRAITQQITAPDVFGITMLFDLQAFPSQITTSPDPIQAANAWTKKHFPQMTIIAHDAMPQVWKPSGLNPAIYWRFEGIESTNKQSYSVTWYAGKFAAHVIATSVTERNKWTKAIIERLQLDEEIVLADESPMFIRQIQVRHNADPLRDGQLSLTGQYGVWEQPRKEYRTDALKNITFG